MINVLIGIGTFITSMFGYFLLFFTRKGLVATASIAAVIATTATVIVCFQGIVNSILALVTIPSWMAMGLSAVIPGNFLQVMGYICSAMICKQAYNLLGEKIRLVNNAN